MEAAFQITFRGMTPSPAVEAAVRDRVDKLARLSPRITACRVAVETGHRRHHGNLVHVRVDLRMPGAEIVASRDPAEQRAHEDAFVAVRDAFDAVERRLEDRLRQRAEG